MIDVNSFLVYWLIEFGILAIVALCLNMETGYTGMANFGLVAFYGVGSFVAGFLSITIILAAFGYNYPIYSLDAIIALGNISNLNPLLNIGIFILSLLCAFVLAGILGYLISYPTLRVGPAFLGITILSFGEMLRIFMKHFKPTGATSGLLGIPHPFAWIQDPILKNGLFLIVTMIILGLSYLFLQSISNSPFGRVLKSIREDEVASLVMGKPVPVTKAKLLFIASGISGVAGALYAFYQGSVSPDMFITTFTFEVWSMVILGGRGNNMGAIVGALLISLFGRLSSIITIIFPVLPIDPNYVRWMLMGVIIVAILMFRPQGILPEKRVETNAWISFESQRQNMISRIIQKIKNFINWLFMRSGT